MDMEGPEGKEPAGLTDDGEPCGIREPAEGEKGMVIYHTYYSLVAIPDISRFNLTSVNS